MGGGSKIDKIPYLFDKYLRYCELTQNAGGGREWWQPLQKMATGL